MTAPKVTSKTLHFCSTRNSASVLYLSIALYLTFRKLLWTKLGLKLVKIGQLQIVIAMHDCLLSIDRGNRFQATNKLADDIGLGTLRLLTILSQQFHFCQRNPHI